ncbi:MAG: hypothetical protein KGI98_10680 [Euryarchaeota archaeon]|nr:hypothetical protein [Euryarchaeota archaeon]
MSELGAHAEVHPRRTEVGWELRWLIGRRTVLSLVSTAQGVSVRFSVPDRAAGRLLEDEESDEEFRAQLRRAPVVQGRRRLEVPLGSARRLHSLVRAVLLLSRSSPQAWAIEAPSARSREVPAHQHEVDEEDQEDDEQEERDEVGADEE